MSSVQIPNLPPATAVSGNELLEAVQNGTSVRLTANQLATLSPAGPTGALGPTGPTGALGPTGAFGGPTGPTGQIGRAHV